MKRTVLAIATLAALAVSGATLQAQDEIGFGIAAGLSNPQREFGRLTDAGYHATASVSFSSPGDPVSSRWEGSVSQFTYAGNLASAGTKVRILSATGNVVMTAPRLLRPYGIAGLGIYNASAECGGCTTRATKAGVNVGGGIRFGLGGVDALVEVRYHYFAGAMGPTPVGHGTGTVFVPVTLGLTF